GAAVMRAGGEVPAPTRGTGSAAAGRAGVEAERSYAHAHVGRLEPLLPQKFVTRDRYDEARVNATAADAAVERARRELERQRQLLAQFGDVNARIAAAEAAGHDSELGLEDCHLRGPVHAPVTEPEN